MGDTNGHLGKYNISFEKVHRGYSFGDRHQEETTI